MRGRHEKTEVGGTHEGRKMGMGVSAFHFILFICDDEGGGGVLSVDADAHGTGNGIHCHYRLKS